jgi:hypothetical protein
VLIYGGRDADAPLVGIAYSAPGADGVPPEGFTGGNDWYHLHGKICLQFREDRSYDILAGAEEIADERCAALGGRQQPLPGGGLFLLHTWLAPGYEYKPDVFASGHPCLLDDGVADPGDPCWDVAMRDPAQGPPPDGGGHGH